MVIGVSLEGIDLKIPGQMEVILFGLVGLIDRPPSVVVVQQDRTEQSVQSVLVGLTGVRNGRPLSWEDWQPRTNDRQPRADDSKGIWPQPLAVGRGVEHDDGEQDGDEDDGNG